MIRNMIATNHLPEYELVEESGDIIHVRPRRAVLASGEGPQLSRLAIEEARRLAPGMDATRLRPTGASGGWLRDACACAARTRPFWAGYANRLERIGADSDPPLGDCVGLDDNLCCELDSK